MFQIPDMKERVFIPEIMDDHAGPEDILFRTFEEFKTVNRLFSRTRTLVKKYLIPRMAQQGNKEFVVADIGAGGCDFALWLTGACRRRGIRIKALCIDNDPRAVDYARRICQGRDDIAVYNASAFDLDTIEGPIDYIFSNHFLHHIADEDIPGLLALFYRRSRCGFLINDLARSRWAYAGFTLFCSVFGRSTLSRLDGLLSIRKGFLKKDIARLVARASLPGTVTIGSMHPGRIFLYCPKDA